MKRIALLTVLVCLLLVVGCSRGLSPSVTESSGLKPLAVFYGRYQSQHRGKPPEKESEFRKFLDALPASELLSFNVKSIDEITTVRLTNFVFVPTALAALPYDDK